MMRSSIRITKFVLLFLSVFILSLALTGCCGWGRRGGCCLLPTNYQKTDQTVNQGVEKGANKQALKVLPGKERKEEG